MKKCVLAVACGVAFLSGCAMMEEKEPTASATLEPRSGSSVRGTVTGHTKGPKGFHIHEKGDCSAPDALSAGGHFNPTKSKHGGPYEPAKHAGDLGNLNFDAAGAAKLSFVVGDISVSSSRPDGIIGRAVIVHAAADDLKTDPTGNASGRVACGVIK